ncbi:methionine--tRNA ligase [Buchnera aphidicola]|uniref:methionine--tRNA ligase n=1 Tax=Buchnera aphidicola TaxID=9 RepID=UPI0030EE5319
MNTKKPFLVTCAFPYSNGDIHIGHLLEHIQADIWVRYHRMQGRSVFFICADDTHGTPIMIKANNMKKTPEELISITLKKHILDFSRFKISYDNYYHTNSKENLYFSNKIYLLLKKNGYINKKKIFQLYDNSKKIFLPDRFVKGQCPNCFAKDQYGDNCEKCSFIYDAIDLIKPKSLLSKSSPVLKESLHIFFNLPRFQKFLWIWIHSGVLSNSVKNKLIEWFKHGLKEWDISRDFPYFGFKIPNYLNKYFYVWLDASIGYISTFKNLCNHNKNINFNDFWKSSKNTNLYHFIGKDIIYFHSLFWPSILEGINFRKPTKIFVHGYVTINNKKMSKSKNFFITAEKWLKNYDSDSLRYYFSSKLNNSFEDIDFNLREFVNKINSDIVNKLVNLASRCSSFINKNFDNYLSKELLDFEIYKSFLKESLYISKLFESLNFKLLIKRIMLFAEKANLYFNSKTPWLLCKNEFRIIHSVSSMGINLFRILMTWMKPIIPDLSLKVEEFLNIKLKWEDIKNPLFNHKISNFKNLYNRIKYKKIF